MYMMFISSIGSTNFVSFAGNTFVFCQYYVYGLSLMEMSKKFTKPEQRKDLVLTVIISLINWCDFTFNENRHKLVICVRCTGS